MKKLYILLIIYLFIIPYGNKVFSYGIDFDGTNLYSTMSNSVSDLQENIYTNDLAGNNGITEKIKEISGIDCLEDNLTQKEFVAITNGEIKYITNNIKDECLDKDGGISLKTQEKILKTIIALNNNLKQNTTGKIQKSMYISQSGIYADGIDSNSPFDLITDLEEIDEIIFEKTKEYDYQGDDNTDLWEKLKEKVNTIKEAEKKVSDSNPETTTDLDESNPNVILCKLNGDCDTQEELEIFLCEELGNCEENLSDNYEIIKNTSICDTDESGLKTITDKIVTIGINKELNNSSNSDYTGKTENNTNQSSDENTSNSQTNNYNNTEDPISDYKQINDSSLFPCNDIFCIDIDFTTYNHELLGGWVNYYPSIEYLLKRSNGHLKPFMNTNLDQTKMTNENFELGIFGVNFSDMFHQAFHIEYKPIPILELEEDKEIDKSYTVENLQKEYYKNTGLDFNMVNSLPKYNGIIENRISVLNSTLLAPSATSDKILKANTQKTLISQKSSLLQRTIQEQLKTRIISDLEEDFIEIETFAKAINYYTVKLDAVLDKLIEIPQETGKT